MSAEQEELNLSELVGNLLAAHNEDELPSQLEQGHTENIGDIPDLSEHSQTNGEFDDEDLAAVVAQAIGGMEGRGTEEADDLEAVQHDGRVQEETGNAGNKEEEWAQILQQGLLQESQLNAPEHIQGEDEEEEEGEQAINVAGSEHLDNEDEALRRAILESLQGFNVTESQPVPPTHTHEPSKVAHKTKDKEKTSRKDKNKDKKAKKSDKASSSKKKAAKKKKESSKKTDKELSKRASTAPKKTVPEISDGDLLNFEDVIKGFMEQAGDETLPQTESSSRDDLGASEGLSGVTDAETRSLVENTLRAFENELLFGSKPATSKKSTSHSRNKPRVTTAAPAPRKPYEGIQPIVQTLPLSKPKKTKAGDHSKKKKTPKKNSKESEYNEDDFSKALADMVNQVVNTTLSDFQPSIRPPSGAKNLAAPSLEVPTEASPSRPVDLLATRKPSISEKNPSRSDDIRKDSGNESLSKERRPSDERKGVLDRFSMHEDADQSHDHASDLSQVSERVFQANNLEDIPGDSLLSFPDAKLASAPLDSVEHNDGFDINQIMQNAMAMAFHGQVEQQLSQSDLNGFNRQLQGYDVSGFMDGSRTSTKGKKKSSKKKNSGEKKAKTKSAKKKKSLDQSDLGRPASMEGGSVMDFNDYKVKPARGEITTSTGSDVKSNKPKLPHKKKISTQELSAALQATGGSIPGLLDDLPKALNMKGSKNFGKLKKALTPQPISDKFWRKKYKTAVTEAAAKARRQRMDRNKANRRRLKEVRHVRRQERHKKREEERSNEERERKELEILVARGPPYPPNLRLTKKGVPKKPYRWYTRDEMKSKNSAISAEAMRAWRSRAKALRHSSRKSALVTRPKKVTIADHTSDKIIQESDDRAKTLVEESAVPIPIIKLQSMEEALSSELPLGLGGKSLKERDESTGRREKKKDNISYESVRSSKTVVHREKIALHPPWVIPERPPLALPIARRKKKGKVRISGSSKSTKSSRRDGNRLGAPSFIAGNKIVPSSLFPIINTLKAAARAKAAAGATPEEASRHLGAMLRNARLTIAQVLARARGRGARDYGSIKTLDDVKSYQSKLDHNKSKKTPFFTLGSIKAITEQNEDTVGTRIDDGSPRAVQCEDKSLMSKEPLISKVAGDKEIRESASIPAPNLEDDRKEDSSSQITSDATKLPRKSTDEDTRYSSSLLNEDKPKTLEMSPGTSRDQALSKSRVDYSHDPEIKQEVSEPPLKKVKSSQVVKLEEIEPLLIDERGALSKDAITPPPAGDDLPPEVKAELARAINDIVNPPEKSRKKYTRRTTPVLNLEGLVPPTSLISKIKPEGMDDALRHGKLSNSSLTHDNLRPLSPLIIKAEARTKTPMPSKPAFEIKHKFDIPTKNIEGQPMPLIPILKRAKNLLTTDDLTKLKKAMTNERKRKWREVNATKNKDHDLRARLKKRANALFGSLESTPKTSWFNQEYSKRSLKIEVETDEKTKLPTQELSTSITDHEVLNMIVCLLDKEDVARAIENQIKTEASKVGPDRKGSKKKVRAPSKVKKVEAVPLNRRESTQTLAENSVNETKKDSVLSQDGASSHSQPSTRIATTVDPVESIDPVFSQMAKRNRSEEETDSFNGLKRAKSDDYSKSEPLKRPAYIDLGGPD
ncbi:Spp41p LALA0_S09e00804g [Lachancea lanzarotensis]|uniref:LALA0S09e00804g1_1 n=1 Tax=Lachancea lanzarotensis TaxID=1245769 RepID=A0A0C7N0P1_9SACH|nr:uncharacterized protein LALA0_S09e00804g [Lachancea lanzarotensis]CEP63712.1 LALA0S09e00804g1_1 [Lachancea lanzarotensis]